MSAPRDWVELHRQPLAWLVLTSPYPSLAEGLAHSVWQLSAFVAGVVGVHLERASHGR